MINASTSAIELAARVSQILEHAGIVATLSGGGAVSIHTANRYQSQDLDFVTSQRRKHLLAALAPHGFELARDRRHFTHPRTVFVLEFPAAPLAFGGQVVAQDDIPQMQTEWGPLRVITPTQCVMDRLAAFWHWHDRQSWDQAVWVATDHDVDAGALRDFAATQNASDRDIDRLLYAAHAARRHPTPPRS